MKERILFIAIGQAGSNIGIEFEQRGYNCLFINSSFEDLKYINARFKLHLPGALGCSRQRPKALEYAKLNYQTVFNVIESRFPMQDIVFYLYSSSGGTGSGMSPVLLDLCTKFNPRKNYGAVIILPDINDATIKQLRNSVEAYKQTVEIKTLKNLFVLDNNNMDKFQINKEFADKFDKFINITNPDPRGIIDESELETLITCQGNAVLEFMNEQKSVFTPFISGSKYIGMSTKEEISICDLQKKYRKPEYDYFKGFNNDVNMVFSFGMHPPYQRFEQMLRAIDKMSQESINIDSYNFNINISKDTTTKEIEIKEDINIEDIFLKYQ